MEDYYQYIILAVIGLLFNFFFKKKETKEQEKATAAGKKSRQATMDKSDFFEEIKSVQLEQIIPSKTPKKYTHYREEEEEKMIGNKKENLPTASSAHKAFFASREELRKAIIYTEIINKKY
ncbi:MAG: hypothetical protein WCQ82_01335 [Bacteroidaceae bacterium]|nr:hypothetical protein [Bacteroidaceae bacterium]